MSVDDLGWRDLNFIFNGLDEGRGWFSAVDFTFYKFPEGFFLAKYA